jgi:hypothetical protein
MEVQGVRHLLEPHITVRMVVILHLQHLPHSVEVGVEQTLWERMEHPVVEVAIGRRQVLPVVLVHLGKVMQEVALVVLMQVVEPVVVQRLPVAMEHLLRRGQVEQV